MTAWRNVDGTPTAWFEASSLVEGAGLAARVLDAEPASAVDLRPGGVRVRLASPAHQDAVSAAAAELGLTADPAVLQQVGLVVETPDPFHVRPWWQQVLGYAETGEGLTDPLRRDPDVLFWPCGQARVLRDPFHLDVSRPAAQVEAARLGPASGPWGVCHEDPDGNEVDVVPGDTLWGGDWHAVFSAVACYRTGSAGQQRDLVTAVAERADAAGFPLLVDVRPGLVVLDSGKDLWEDADLGFESLAGELQEVARGRGATADATLPRFVQVFLDAADVATVRAFWAEALGYVPDAREGVTDIVDPRRLSPEMVFQTLDVTDEERRTERNRVHVRLTVPADAAQGRLARALDSGGRLLDRGPARVLVADPEGNELEILAGGAR